MRRGLVPALRRTVERLVASAGADGADGAAAPPADRAATALDAAVAEAARSRAELRAARARFDALLARAPIGLAYLDGELRLAHQNDAIAQIHGLPPDEAVGRPVSELVPALWPQIEPGLHAALTTGEPQVDIEVSGPAPAEPGVERHWLASCYPVLDGSAIGADGSVRGDQRVEGVGVVVVEITARKRAERAARLLGRVGELFASELDVAGAVEAAASVVVPEFADACVLCLLDADGDVEQLAFSLRGHEGDEVAVTRPDRCPVSVDDATAVGATLVRGEPVLAATIDPAAPPDGLEELADVYGARSAIVVPLRHRDRRLGVAAFVYTDASELRFRDDDVSLAVDLGIRLGQLVTGVQLAEDARQAQTRLSIVARVSEVVESDLDVASRAEAVARLAVPDFADHASLYLLDPERGVLYFAGGAHADPDVMRAMHAIEWPEIDLESPSAPATAVRTNSSVLRPYQPNDGPARSLLPDRPNLADAFATRSVLSVPLRGPEGPLGALFFSYSRARRYDEHDRTLAEELARIAAPAMHNALRFQQERHTGETLQRSLLPQALPSPTGVRVATRYLPGTAGLQVGGDWYDVVLVGDVAVLVIGDVVGHSIEAAVSMGRFRTVLQFAARQTTDPARILERINEFIASSFPGEMATLLVLSYEPGTGRARLASAGHLPPAIRTPDDEVLLLEVKPGLPVCVDAGARYEDSEVALQPGTLLVLYTDGLVERRGEVLDIGLDRLVAALATAAGHADDVADHLVAELLPESGPADDVALLVAEFTLVADRLQLHFPADPRHLRTVRADARAWLTHLGFADEQADDVVLAVNEAVANAVEHAYADMRPGAVWVDGRLEDGEAVVVVRDEGAWRPPEPSATRGRGLPIMRALMDDVGLDVRVEGAEVTLRRRLPGSALR